MNTRCLFCAACIDQVCVTPHRSESASLSISDVVLRDSYRVLRGIEHDENGYRLVGYPDGCSIAGLVETESRWLKDLALHGADLAFAQDCLLPFENGRPPKPLDDALWRASIVAFFKCFQRNGARSRPLAASTIFDREGRKIFRYFEGLRNGHIAHDSNDVASVAAGMVLDPGGSPLEVVTLTAQRDMISPENYSNLRRLIAVATDWVHESHEDECARLVASLPAEHFEGVERHISFDTPQAINVNSTRKP